MATFWARLWVIWAGASYEAKPPQTGQTGITAYRFIDVTSPGPAPLFRLLGDEARLRILRLLEAERLNVTELTAILGIAQSGVSRHLGLLKDAGLVEERRDAGFTFFRLSPGLRGVRTASGRCGRSLRRILRPPPQQPKDARTMRGSKRFAAFGRRTSTITARTANGADHPRPELGRLGARAWTPPAAAGRRRPRLRRRLPDCRSQPVREEGDRRRSIRGRPGTSARLGETLGAVAGAKPDAA